MKFKNPLKSNLQIKEIANKKAYKGVPVNEEEWKGIIYYLYETEDAKNLEGKIIEFIRRKNFEKQNFDMNTYLSNTCKKQTRAELNSPLKEDLEIDYKSFLGIILDYQIKCRTKYLRNINYLFKELDTDENGILNENELIQLVANTDLFNEGFSEHSNRLLNLVDPYNHKQVTFSEVVTCFSKETVKESDTNGNVKKINLLDKISSKDYIHDFSQQ